VLTKQWPNGCFEVTAFKPDERGVVGPIEYPTMHKSNIFLSNSDETIELPERVVSLEVSRQNPSGAILSLEGEDFSRQLGRASPKASGQSPQRIKVEVPKRPRIDPAQKLLQQNVLGMVQQEEPVQINVGATTWEHFLSGEVRRGEGGANRLERSRTLQLGPFATHTIRLTKKSHMSAVMTLIVDDEILVECASPDIGGPSDMFRCNFRFVGERLLDFSVFEETKDGVPLDTKGIITQPYEYCHSVEVAYRHRAVDNLVDATLAVDGCPFEHLPFMIQVHHEQQSLSISPTAMQGQFSIQIPKIVVPEDTRGIARQIGMNVVNQAGGWSAIGESAAQTATGVAQNLQTLGLSAWEMMFLSKGMQASSQPTGGAQDFPMRSAPPAAPTQPTAGPSLPQFSASQPARYVGRPSVSDDPRMRTLSISSTPSIANEGYYGMPQPAGYAPRMVASQIRL